MPFKVTLLFQQGTGAAAGQPTLASHIGGWSESVYTSNPSITAVRTAILGDPVLGGGLAPLRAQLLPASGSVVGYRIAQVLPRVGKAQTQSVVFPGSPSRETDVPQMALQCSINSASTNNVRRFSIRGVPDDQVIDGEFAPDAGYQTRLSFYATELSNWQFLGQDLTVPFLPVTSIDVTGLVIMAAPPGYLVGDTVQFRNVRIQATGQLVSFKAKVTVAPIGGVTFTITPPPLLAMAFGEVRKVAFALFTMDGNSFQVARVAVRKVGRPFGQYRGRRSRRRGR